MTSLQARSLAAFVRAIAIVALDHRGQMEWLSSLGLPGEPALSDEIAQEFDEGFKLVTQYIESGWLPSELMEFLRPIDDAFTRASGQDAQGFWDIEALSRDPRWEELRKYARMALNSIH